MVELCRSPHGRGSRVEGLVPQRGSHTKTGAGQTLPSVSKSAPALGSKLCVWLLLGAGRGEVDGEIPGFSGALQIPGHQLGIEYSGGTIPAARWTWQRGWGTAQR